MGTTEFTLIRFDPGVDLAKKNWGGGVQVWDEQ